jgi:hypothetical protein
MWLSFVVCPWNTEHNDALGFCQAFQNCILFQFWHFVYNGRDGLKNKTNSLEEVTLIGIASTYFVPYALTIRILNFIIHKKTPFCIVADGSY